MKPLRIVSLVPSLTETLVEIGLRKNLIGITKFCVHPPDLHRGVTLIGGTKDPDIKKIASLSPSHIITNAEENRAIDIEACQAIAPTLVTLPKGPRDVSGMLMDMQTFFGFSNEEATAIEKRRRLLEAVLKDLDRWKVSSNTADYNKSELKRFVYLIWREPYMAAGKDTYISRTLEEYGFENSVESEERYPSVGVEQLWTCRPDILFLSTEPYPFRRRDRDRLQTEWSKDARLPTLVKVDGQDFSWYGTRTSDVLKKLLNAVKAASFEMPPFLIW